MHQSVVFDPVRDVNPQQVLTRVENKDTTLTAWFKANAGDQHGVIRDTVTTLQGRLIQQVTWRRCSNPRDDTESCGLSVGL